MEFNLSSFFLEIINFLILVWILQRLFYRPIRDMIARRKELIDHSLGQAEQMRKEAEQLKKNYQNRQHQWEQEKQAAIAHLHQQLEKERDKVMSKLQEELDQERHKARTAMHKQQQEIHLQQQKLALMNGSRFAALILRQAAGPELEQRLFELLLSQLQQLPEACIQSLQTVDSNNSLEINVSHAYPITHEQQQRLEQKFASLIDNPMQFQYDQNTQLIAGFKIDIGAWILHADLQHELSGFTEIASDF